MRTYNVMLAKAVATLPTGDEWMYEVKWDGYRLVAVKDGPRVTLLSRTQTDLTRHFPQIATAVSRLAPSQLVLDGELVALDRTGRPSFTGLQEWHRRIRGPGSGLALAFFAFDLLELNRRPWMQTPLSLRRRRLAEVVADASPILLSSPLPGRLVDIERTVRRMRLEGIVAKRRGSLYRPGERSTDWQKVRFDFRQEFVVGGYRPNGNGFESLLVGYYEGGEFRFAGQVREGFKKRTRAMLMDLLRTRAVSCPFVNLPSYVPYRRRHPFDQRIGAAAMPSYRWVAPSVVCEVAFLGWTRHHLLRQGRFLGIRDDKVAHAVQREEPMERIVV